MRGLTLRQYIETQKFYMEDHRECERADDDGVILCEGAGKWVVGLDFITGLSVLGFDTTFEGAMAAWGYSYITHFHN